MLRKTRNKKETLNVFDKSKLIKGPKKLMRFHTEVTGNRIERLKVL